MAIEVIDAADQDGPDWQLHIDSTTSIVEFAALLAGLGIRATVEFVDDGPTGLRRGAIVRPIDIGSPKPTLEQIRAILEHGLAKLPQLRVVWRLA